MYVFWWNKPLDVRCPIVIRTKAVEKMMAMRLYERELLEGELAKRKLTDERRLRKGPEVLVSEKESLEDELQREAEKMLLEKPTEDHEWIFGSFELGDYLAREYVIFRFFLAFGYLGVAFLTVFSFVHSLCQAGWAFVDLSFHSLPNPLARCSRVIRRSSPTLVGNIAPDTEQASSVFKQQKTKSESSPMARAAPKMERSGGIKKGGKGGKKKGGFKKKK